MEICIGMNKKEIKKLFPLLSAIDDVNIYQNKIEKFDNFKIGIYDVVMYSLLTITFLLGYCNILFYCWCIILYTIYRFFLITKLLTKYYKLKQYKAISLLNIQDNYGIKNNILYDYEKLYTSKVWKNIRKLLYIKKMEPTVIIFLNDIEDIVSLNTDNEISRFKSRNIDETISYITIGCIINLIEESFNNLTKK